MNAQTEIAFFHRIHAPHPAKMFHKIKLKPRRLPVYYWQSQPTA
jgi:hypothetical protein